MKCEDCLNARRVLSENGLHALCCLSEKKAIECLTGKKNYEISIEKIKGGRK